MALEKRIGWGKLLRTIRGQRIYGWFSVTDPAPFLHLLGCLLRTSFRQLGKRILSSAGRRKQKRGIDAVRQKTSQAEAAKSATTL